MRRSLIRHIACGMLGVRSQEVEVPWYLSEGVSESDVYNAWTPKGAASYVASKVGIKPENALNQINPGLYWNTVSGWSLINGVTNGLYCFPNVEIKSIIIKCFTPSIAVGHNLIRSEFKGTHDFRINIDFPVPKSADFYDFCYGSFSAGNVNVAYVSPGSGISSAVVGFVYEGVVLTTGVLYKDGNKVNELQALTNVLQAYDGYYILNETGVLYGTEVTIEAISMYTKILTSQQVADISQKAALL